MVNVKIPAPMSLLMVNAQITAHQVTTWMERAAEYAKEVVQLAHPQLSVLHALITYWFIKVNALVLAQPIH